MRSRILFFMFFQIVAWWLYFHWDRNFVEPAVSKSQKILQVVEVASTTPMQIRNGEEIYKLVLRNDGFFTKINLDRSIENGLWLLNYDIPSIILKSPVAEYKYRIIDDSDETLQLELINTHEIQNIQKSRQKDSDEGKHTLFSSSFK